MSRVIMQGLCVFKNKFQRRTKKSTRNGNALARKRLRGRPDRPRRAGSHKMSLQPAGRILTMLLLLVTASGYTGAQGEPFEGYWATSNLTSIVEITSCEDALCAEIVWLWDVSVAGRKMLDEKNSQDSKKNNPLVGRQLFSRFSKEADAWKGRIYNPEDGRTYRATVTARNNNALRVKGCWGPFCLSQTWRRLQSISIPTESDLERRR